MKEIEICESIILFTLKQLFLWNVKTLLPPP